MQESAKQAEGKTMEAKKDLKKKDDNKSSSGQVEGSFTCTLEKDTRTISIVKDGDRCRVDYTKFGDTKTIANGNADSDYCSKTQERVKNNLSSYGFTCK